MACMSTISCYSATSSSSWILPFLATVPPYSLIKLCQQTLSFVSVKPVAPIMGLRVIAPQTVPKGKPTAVMVRLKSGDDVTVTLYEDGQAVKSEHITGVKGRVKLQRPLFRHPLSRSGQRLLTVTATNSVSSASVHVTVSVITPITELNISIAVHDDQSVSFEGRLNDANEVMCIHSFGDGIYELSKEEDAHDTATTQHVYTWPGTYTYRMNCYNLFSNSKLERVVNVRPSQRSTIVVEILARLHGASRDVGSRAGGDMSRDDEVTIVPPNVPLRLTFVSSKGRSELRSCMVHLGDTHVVVTSFTGDAPMEINHTYKHEGKIQFLFLLVTV